MQLHSENTSSVEMLIAAVRRIAVIPQCINSPRVLTPVGRQLSQEPLLIYCSSEPQDVFQWQNFSFEKMHAM